MSFSGKVVLVTGGTGGIGRVTAQHFGRAGAKVAVTGRRDEEGKQTVALLKSEGCECAFFRADVSKEDDCRQIVELTLETYGRIDCVFNNAGVEGQLGPVTEQTADNFHYVMNINVLGMMLCLKYQVPALRKCGGGAIVNNASIAGVIGMPGGSVYFASKHAVLGLTKVVALETARENIRVNAVSPAAIQTDMWDRFTGNDAKTQEHMAQLHPLGRIGTADEIASAVLFLCSSGASFITGTNLIVDGGFTAA